MGAKVVVTVGYKAATETGDFTKTEFCDAIKDTTQGVGKALADIAKAALEGLAKGSDASMEQKCASRRARGRALESVEVEYTAKIETTKAEADALATTYSTPDAMAAAVSKAYV